jgi:hypothetical protein
MSQPVTQDTSQYTDNKEHDSLFKAKRITDVGSDNQVIVDEAAAPATTYVGTVGRGIATSASGWLIKKIVVSGTTTTITHAIGIWDNRASETYS